MNLGVRLLLVVVAGMTSQSADATEPGDKPELDEIYFAAKQELDKWRGGPMLEQLYEVHLGLLEQDGKRWVNGTLFA